MRRDESTFVQRGRDLIVLVIGIALVIAGIASPAPESQIPLCMIGAALVLLPPVLTRATHFKIAATGIEADMVVERQEAIAESQRLGKSLDVPGLRLRELALGGGSGTPAPEVEGLLRSLLERLSRLDRANESAQTEVPSSVLLEVAHGLLAEGRWAEAARQLDRYVDTVPEDWDAHVARAVAYSNSRQGRRSDLQALRAYNDALAHRPTTIDKNLLARLFSYRGAMLKRLDRLAEAESDLRIAQALATAEYEIHDIAYNFACIYAKRRKRTETIECVKQLAHTPYIAAIRAHLDDYFRPFAEDDEFLALLDASA